MVGLPAADARRAWSLTAPSRAEVRVEGHPAAVPRAWAADLRDRAAGRAGVRLLPAFDTYLLGYRTRDHAVDEAHARRVWPGGGVIRPVVIADGRAVATWSVRPGPAVAVDPFADLDPSLAPALAAEQGDVARFLA